MDQRDSLCSCLLWIARSIRAALNLHRAAVRFDQPRQHIHQGAFAGPVLTNHRMHFSCTQLKIDAVQRHCWTEGFADIWERQDSHNPSVKCRVSVVSCQLSVVVSCGANLTLLPTDY